MVNVVQIVQINQMINYSHRYVRSVQKIHLLLSYNVYIKYSELNKLTSLNYNMNYL
jgi:hypothetical protein